MRDNEDLGYHLHLASAESASMLQQGQKMENTKYATLFDNGVCVLDLIGPIYPRSNMMTMSGAVSIAQFTNDFVRAYENNSVSAIVLNIDSPGGDVRGIGDAAEMMFNLTQKGKKPVKAFAFGYMASAAYYIGSIANDVTGSKSSVVGSIGVVMQVMKANKEMIEITSSQSPNKRLDPSKDEDVAKIRQRLDDLAEIFISDVARYRGITPEKVLSNYGQGDVFVGPRAKKQGLIDKIGTLSSVVAEAAKEAERGTMVSRKAVRQSYEAGDGSDAQTLLQFNEEDIMGLKDLANKFGIGTQAQDDATLDAATTEEESDETVASEGQVEGQEEATVAAEATVPSREEICEQFSDAAENFALTLTIENRIFPAQQAHAAGLLLNAKADDVLVGGSVEYVDANGEVAHGTREDMVKAMFATMPKHSMTQQAIKGIKEGTVTASVLAEADPETVKDGPLTAERRAELLKLTEQGQKVLSRSN